MSYDDLSGLGKRHPAAALAFSLFLLSLAGIPPTAGFFGKWFVFKAAIDGGLYWLAIVAFVNSVIGAYYYLRVLVYMYMREPAAGAPVAVPMRSGYVAAALVVSAVLVLALGSDADAVARRGPHGRGVVRRRLMPPSSDAIQRSVDALARGTDGGERLARAACDVARRRPSRRGAARSRRGAGRPGCARARRAVLRRRSAHRTRAGRERRPRRRRDPTTPSLAGVPRARELRGRPAAQARGRGNGGARRALRRPESRGAHPR